jgi:hypothetical protein
MKSPRTRKSLPKAKALTYAEFQPVSTDSTLDQLKALISFYTGGPVRSADTLVSLLADNQMLLVLAADINAHWKFGKKGLRPGEIEAGWTVYYLAGYIDLIIAE